MSAFIPRRSRSNQPASHSRSRSRSILAPFAVVALTMLLVAMDLAASVGVGAFVEPTPTEQFGFEDASPPLGVPTEIPGIEFPDGQGFPAEAVEPTDEEDVPTISPDFPTETVDPTDEPTGVVRLTPPDVISIDVPTETVVPTMETVVPTEDLVTEEPRRHESNTITIWKSFCPAGTPHDLTLANFVLVCGSAEPVEFTLVDGLGFHTQMTDGGGFTQWTGVEIGQEGELQIHETVPDGYGEPIVFCGDHDAAMIAMPVSGGMVIPMPTSYPFTYDCAWYNIPVGDPGDGGSVVEITKAYCPAGTGTELAYEDYVALCTEFRDTSFTLTDSVGASTRITDASGNARWDSVATDEGAVAIIEDFPTGYGDPLFFCGYVGEGTERVGAPDGIVVLVPDRATYSISCHVFNIPIPTDDEGGDVTLVKYPCPAGTAKTDDFYALGETCFEEIPPVDFTVTATGGGYGETKTADPGVPQQAVFVNVPFGEIAIEESVPDGYSWPLVFCSDTRADGPGAYFPVEPWPESGAFILEHRAEAEIALTCLVFNVPDNGDDTPAGLTIVKYTCPVNYDLFAPGADPYVDCPTLTDGVSFVLDDGQPGLDVGGTTGDSGTGTIAFADVTPGSYTVHEILSPGMGEPFVLECLGNAPQLQPYPLWSGNDLPLTIHPGDDIVCHWFNVPASDPELGTLTVTKYICTTETFISDVDCQIFEGGQTFDLLAWDSVQWNVLATATTDAFGRIVWTDLPIGHYMLAEHDGPWCHVTSSALLGNDDSFNINQQGGMDQTADVYNCGADPRVPGETPKTYPNTGVDAGATDSPMRVASRDERRTLPRDESEAETTASVASPCLPADDTGAASGDQACLRGAVPVTIRIDAIGVDAPIEMKETVGGVMQQPTGETAVAWYKESARLGESGNMLFAGHLNWWGIPQAVFFALGTLKEGDEIVLTDASGATWTYRVSSVQQEDAFAPPSAEVVGPTESPAITLITCGGEWNIEAGLYDERTVVRAVLVDSQPAAVANSAT